MKQLLMIVVAGAISLNSWALFKGSGKTYSETVDGVEYFYVLGEGENKGEAILENDSQCAVNIIDDKTELVLPDSLGGCPLTAISGHACANLIELEQVKLPAKLKYIGYRAFEGCTSLKLIVIPSGVKEIHGEVFKDCEKLTTVNLPKGTKGIELKHAAFEGCTGLERIDLSGVNCVVRQANGIESKLVALPYDMFNGCVSLKYIKLPDNVRELGNRVFGGCKSLECVDLPPRIEKIGSSAFKDCSKLREISLPETVKEIEDSAFQGCASLKKIEIPFRVGRIESHTFQWCSSLETITIPENVTCIEHYAFADCTALKEVVISPSVERIAVDAFLGCKNLKTFKIPASLKNAIPKLELAPGVKCVRDMPDIKTVIVE